MEEAATNRAVSTRPAIALLGVALVVFVADQVSKAAIAATIPIGDRIDVIGDVVQLWHAQNRGAAFSLLQGELWLFFIVTGAALVMVAYFHRTLRGRSIWLQVILGVILGGTLGNFTDRARLGYVVDFLSVGLGDTRFPTFNVADSAVVCGIGLLVIYLSFFDRHEGHAQID
jgi:signal peptidase II